MRQKLLAVLVINICTISLASVSTNVPLSHWSYDAIERLADYGYTNSDLLSTKPITRLNMARLILEAEQKLDASKAANSSLIATLSRLKEEYAEELKQLELDSGTRVSAYYLKPLEDPYVRYVYADKMPNLENEQGRHFQSGSNAKTGFALRGQPTNRLAFYVHPELESPSPGDNGFDVIEGYGKLALGPVELEIGKDSLWWGPGYHGGMIMSSNTKPFEMLKISQSEPILLPGFLRKLGPIKGVFFLTELESSRSKAYAKLSGLRITMKPKPNVEVGLSRTLMFGGAGNPSIGVEDSLQIFWPMNIQGQENQLAGFDVTWRLVLPKQAPAESMKIYGEYVGETGRTDLRLEYAKTFVGDSPNAFYTHSIFTSGYTYDGRVIGHHVGTGSRDVFVRLTHWLRPDLRLGFDFDRQTDMRTSPRPKIDQLGMDVMCFGPKKIQIQGRYRYEFAKYQAGSGLNGNNHIFDFSFIYRY